MHNRIPGSASAVRRLLIGSVGGYPDAFTPIDLPRAKVRFL